MRLIVLVLATVGLGSAAQDVNPAADEAAVRDVVGRYVEAREHRDPRAVEALFTKTPISSPRRAIGGAAVPLS